MTNHQVILKPGKEKAIRNRHHWIFSGAVANFPKIQPGDFASVYSSDKVYLGSAYFNKNAKIIGRMVSFDQTPPLEAIENHLNQALNLRQFLFSGKSTNAYRLVNGEGDLLPGLIVDKYRDVLVIQLSTLGMDKLRAWIVDYFVKKLYPKSIFEKSHLPSRTEEGLEDYSALLYGEPFDEIEIIENDLRFLVSIKEGQKTGFFLDQREMRQTVRSLSNGKNVLNCFSYTGGFSVYAMAGGAKKVDTVDISESAIEMAKKNCGINHFPESQQGFFVADVFQFLRENSLNYEFVILDPPAFAKKSKDLIAACRGYKDINRVAMQKMPPGSLLLTSSCSYHVNAELFQKVIFQASIEAKRTAKIIGTHLLAADHPINLCHRESEYLKSLLVYIE